MNTFYINLIIFLLVSIIIVLLIKYFFKKSIRAFKKELNIKNDELEASSHYLKQYTAIIERSNIVSKTNIDGTITYVSDEFCKLTGYKRDELIGKNHNILRHPDSPNDFFERLWYIIKSKQTFRSLIKVLSKDGKTIYLLTTISPILDKNGEIIEFIAHRYDFTTEVELNDELIKQNKMLKKSKDSLDEAQRIAHLGNWEYDFLKDKFYFSNEALNIYGFDSNENGKSLKDFRKIFFQDEINQINDEFVNSIKNKIEVSLEHKVMKKNGSISIVEVTAKHDFDKNGNLIKTYGIVHDITSKKAIQKELDEKEILLFQQSKMAAMGEMISNIAHQWRQPLSAISTAATGTKLQKELGVLDDKTLNETLEMINSSVQYLSTTIDDFRNFFNPNYEKKLFKIKESISKAVDLVKPQYITKNIRIITKIDDFEYFGSENEFIQVVINLLNNARDELVKIEEEKLILVETYKDESNYYISIKDNACGIPCDIINKIFEPYFTTKDKSEGTGIGLYMSSEIIIKHMNGDILAQNSSFEYENKIYEGANFVISLPIKTKEKI